MIRKPIAAGTFYPKDPDKLIRTIDNCFMDGPGKKPYTQRSGVMPGLIAPHAGYLYSGSTAAYPYYELSKYAGTNFVILGPNHTGFGDPISILSHVSMETPLGSVSVNKDLRDKVIKALNIEPEFFAHQQEHSIEVQLPFLQYLYKDLTVLPIVIGDAELNDLIKLGSILSRFNATIIASSDFTHHGEIYGYTPFTNVKVDLYDHDANAINKIIKLDVKGFHELAAETTICGYKPITVLMQAMKMKGIKSGTLIKYSTSADVTRDYENVVAYASIVFR